MGKNIFPVNCRFFPIFKGVFALDYKYVVVFKSLFVMFCWLYLIACFFLQTFHLFERIRKKLIPKCQLAPSIKGLDSLLSNYVFLGSSAKVFFLIQWNYMCYFPTNLLPNFINNHNIWFCLLSLVPVLRIVTPSGIFLWFWVQSLRLGPFDSLLFPSYISPI